MAKRGSGGKAASVAWATPPSRYGRPTVQARQLTDFVGGASPLARLQNHAGELSRIQRSLDLLLPDFLAGAVQVANHENRVLALHVPGAAVAARLKMLVPRLREGLWAQGHGVEEIRVRVRPPRNEAAPKAVTVRTVSEDTLDHLANLRAALPDRSPLAGPLDRLINQAIKRR